MKKIPTNAWFAILFVVTLITFVFAYSRENKTKAGPIRKELTEFQKDSVARASVAVQISNRRMGKIEEAEGYVRTFNLEDREGLQPLDYVTTCQLLDEYGGIAKSYADNDDTDVKSRALKLQKDLKSLRLKAMPVLRKRWAEAVNKKMWEDNIEVRCYGKGNRIIEFTGGLFASNANIKTAQEGIENDLLKLRFLQAHYKWYSGDDEHTYYKMSPLPDGDL